MVNLQSIIYINYTFKNISRANEFFMSNTHEENSAEKSQKTEGNLLLNIPRHRLWRDTKMNHEEILCARVACT
jgi:hypothetical protein